MVSFGKNLVVTLPKLKKNRLNSLIVMKIDFSSGELHPSHSRSYANKLIKECALESIFLFIFHIGETSEQHDYVEPVN